MNNRCLIICPTYKRPKQYTRMIESFYNNSMESDIITLTAEGSITKLINSVDYSGYDYVGVTNDDVIYRTNNWDVALMETIDRKGFGFAFGNDGTNNKELPAICIMSTIIPKALGWIQYPKLEHLCGDMVWQYLGKRLNCLHYVPQVKIEHMHFMFNKANKSDYLRTNSDEMYKKDNDTFKYWLLHYAEDDVKKIKSRLEM